MKVKPIRTRTSVGGITQQWGARCSEMRADLVGTPGEWGGQNSHDTRLPPQHLEEGSRTFARPHGHATPTPVPDRQVHLALIRKLPHRHRKVAFLDLLVGKSLVEQAVRGGAARHHQAATGVGVQPMTYQQPRLCGDGWPTFSWGNHRDSCWFIEDYDAAVFIEDGKIQRLHSTWEMYSISTLLPSAGAASITTSLVALSQCHAVHGTPLTSMVMLVGTGSWSSG